MIHQDIITPAADDPASIRNELKEVHRQLARAAHHDWLTGLPSRAQLMERLVSLDTSRLLSTALLFIDLDDFKDVNDTYGHGEGDDLLRHVADRLRGCIRPGDVLARLGGDEFAILLEGANAAAAEELARLVLEAMIEPFVVGDEPRWITASVGVAVGAVADSNPHELLRFADLAMYDAKTRGKNRLSKFETAMSDALILRTRTEGELRRAVDGEQLPTTAPSRCRARARWLRASRPGSSSCAVSTRAGATHDPVLAGQGKHRGPAGPHVGGALPGPPRPVTPQARKRKRSDYERWERSRAMELWQMDIVGGVRLADGSEAEIVSGIDDHSRFVISAALVARATARPVCDARSSSETSLQRCNW